MAIGVSQAFKDAMQAPVKVLRASITTEDNVAYTSSDDLTNFAVETSGYYFGATTKAISFNLLGTTYNLLDKYVRVTLSVQTDSVNDTWEDCFLGKFKIYEQNANLEKETTSFKAYDIIGVMANDYYTEGSLLFPCTIEGLVEQISQRYGLSYTPGNLVNGSHNITEDLYAKINNITFRDILAEIAGATATIASVDGINNTLKLQETLKTTSETWTYDNLKAIKFEPKYGAINAVTLSREPAGDNVSVIYEPVISGEGTEIEFSDINRFKSVEMHGDTEQQTYSGKNKAKYNATYSANGIDSVLNSDGSLTCSGTTTTTYFNTLPYQAKLPSMLPAGTYTFSRGGDTTYAVQIQLWDSTKNQTLAFRIPAGQTKITDTTTFDAYYYGSSFVHLSANMQINTTVKLQLESGSSATSFEPYVGGTASPNPDYPQNVNVVTGRQVVTISDGGSQSQEYEINLGDIELCKIGTYQDYIYKSGDDWYVHKAVGKNTISSTDVTQGSDYTNVYFAAFPKQSDDLTYGAYPNIQSQVYSAATFRAYSSRWDRDIYIGKYVSSATSTKYWVGFPAGTTLADAKAYLYNSVLYYALATPTDTKITDATLKSQLNALFAANISGEKTYISVSGDMPAILDIDAFENVPDVKEIKLANNEILDDNRESMITPILNSVNGFEFYPFEATTEGHGWHECGDRISVTDGTNTWDVIVTYTKITIDGGIKETIKGVRPDESQTNYALAGGIMKTIYNTEIKVDKQGQEITSIVSRQDSFENQTLENFSQITQNINSVTTTIQTTGGGNLIHNSVGYNKETNEALVNWSVTGTVVSESSPESLSYGAISGSQIDLAATSSIIQRITVDGSGSQFYTLSLRAKKGATGVATIHLRNEIDDYTVNIPAGSSILWEQYSIVGAMPHSVYFDVVVETDSSVTELSITDLMLSVGDSTTPWVSASDEILSKNVAVDNSGVTVRSNTTNDYTQLNELGLNGYSDASGTMENVFTVNRDTTEVSKLKARKQISMSPIKIVPVTSGNRAGWSFTKES